MGGRNVPITMSERILDSMPLGMVVIDRAMTVVRYNESAAKIMGLPVNEALGRNIDEVFQPRTDERVIQVTIEKEIEFSDYEVQVMVQGQPLWMLVHTRLMRSEQGDVIGATMVFSDITAVKEMELGLVRSARLVTIGEMAAGAAHEIRNPLTVIKGFLQLWQKEDAHPFLPLIFEEIDQIDRIIQQFLQLGKKDLFHKEGYFPFDLQDTVRDLSKLCFSEAILKGIDLQVQHALHALPVCLNRTEFKQILVNLIRNSFDAFPAEQELKQVTISARRRDRHAAVFIVDNGKGMSKALLQQVRNAFYTTKQSGTGLGLAICEQLADRNGCRFRLYSREDRGTIVVLQVPLMTAEEQKDQSA